MCPDFDSFTDDQFNRLVTLEGVTGVNRIARIIYVRPGFLGAEDETVLYQRIYGIVGLPFWVEESNTDASPPNPT